MFLSLFLLGVLCCSLLLSRAVAFVSSFCVGDIVIKILLLPLVDTYLFQRYLLLLLRIVEPYPVRMASGNGRGWESELGLFTGDNPE